MSETKISSTVWGQLPWSDKLLTISGDVSRGRRSAADLEAQALEDFSVLSKTMKTAGINYAGNSADVRLDYLRDTVQSADGFSAGINQAPLARWFNTNTFYRQPTINDRLGLAQPLANGVDRAWKGVNNHEATYQPTLLSPFAFAYLCNRASGISPWQAEHYVLDLYDKLFDKLGRENVSHVLLHEPYAPYHQVDEIKRERLGRNIASLACNHPNIEIGIFFSFGDSTELVNDLADRTQVKAIGCDLQRTPISGLQKLTGKRFLAGLVDGDSTSLVSDLQIKTEAEAVMESIEPEELSITHTVDLEHVPLPYALYKISQLGRLAHYLGEKL